MIFKKGDVIIHEEGGEAKILGHTFSLDRGHTYFVKFRVNDYINGRMQMGPAQVGFWPTDLVDQFWSLKETGIPESKPIDITKRFMTDGVAKTAVPVAKAEPEEHFVQMNQQMTQLVRIVDKSPRRAPIPIRPR